MEEKRGDEWSAASLTNWQDPSISQSEMADFNPEFPDLANPKEKGSAGEIKAEIQNGQSSASFLSPSPQPPSPLTLSLPLSSTTATNVSSGTL